MIHWNVGIAHMIHWNVEISSYDTLEFGDIII